jgi:MoaA/NifB/PqqE/SkfB family radical SAM enzyme
MPGEIFSRIAADVFPIAKTVGISCGAEPLANPEFHRYLKELYESKVPYREMVTNGTLLNRENISFILRYPPTSLFVSIDGATPETHAGIRDGADLEKIICMLKILIKERGKKRFPMVGFSTTLQKDNYLELEDIVLLAAATGAVSAGVVPLVPYEGLNTLKDVVNPDSPDVAAAIEKAENTAQQKGIHLHLSRNVVREEGLHPCPYLTGTVYIDPDGSVFPCPYWNTENPMGNIMDGFQAIWHGKEYTRLRNGAFREGDNCLMCPETTEGGTEIVKGKQ